MCKSSFLHLRNIFKIRKFLSFDSTKTLVHAFITSKVDYCNSLLYGQPKCVLQDLQRVLNCSARLIYSTSKFEHVTPLILNLLWLPVEQRIIFKIALVTFKDLHDVAPSYITELIRPYKPGRTLRSSSRNLLAVPRFNLKTNGGRSFTVAAPTIWNSLPLELRTCASLSTFKSKLKTWLFKEAFGLDFWTSYIFIVMINFSLLL